MSHFIEKCSCGEIITQCRCMNPNKEVRIIEKGCKKCQQNHIAEVTKMVSSTQVPSGGEIEAKKTNREMFESFENIDKEVNVVSFEEALEQEDDTIYFIEIGKLKKYIFSHSRASVINEVIEMVEEIKHKDRGWSGFPPERTEKLGIYEQIQASKDEAFQSTVDDLLQTLKTMKED